ncbi:hypothetical protein [Sulfuriferula nivalis]|uniref:Uncharacterized protein n=1 Tax=Sulfuriferula nivalis TaxID=2675298 RepID=A0A809RLU1_9PROT|nr:hypothetical protein [Sulfuriferula nivalis]BBP02526.1 hypothetical protein SFSGTM_32340 [Sulfuriferula nivalis]
MNNNIESNLSTAREKFKATGKSPKAVGREKEIAALLWVYRFGFSSKKIVDSLNMTTTTGLSNRLVKKELLVETKTASGSPPTFLTLSRAGLEIATSHSNQLLNYQLDPYRSRQDHFRHDLFIQKTALKAIKNGHTFLTESELAEKSVAGEKQFDLIIIMSDKRTVGVEIELSAKWERDLDFFVRGCSLSIKNKKVDLIQIVSDSKAILNRYQKALSPSATYAKWTKNSNGKWVKENDYLVGEEVENKIFYELIEV